MFYKKVLAAAVVIGAAMVLAPLPAPALLDLTLTPQAATAFSAEEATPDTPGPGVTFENAGAIYDVSTALGVTIAAASPTPRYVRFDYSGPSSVVFAGEPVPTTDDANATVVNVAGGNLASFVIVEITAGATIVAATAKVTMSPLVGAGSGFTVADTSVDVTVNTATYADLTAAAAQTGDLASDSGLLISFQPSAAVEFTTNTVSAPQATIASDFLDFAAAGGSNATNGNLGKVDFVLIDPDGAGGQGAPFDKTGTEIAIIADLVGVGSSFTASGSFDTATAVQFGTAAASCAALVTPGPTNYDTVIAADKQSVLVTGTYRRRQGPLR